MEELIFNAKSLEEDVDLDNIKKAGFYQTKRCKHQPERYSTHYGDLKVETYYNSFIQYFSSNTKDSSLFYRNYDDVKKEWGGWTELQKVK